MSSRSEFIQHFAAEVIRMIVLIKVQISILHFAKGLKAH